MECPTHIVKIYISGPIEEAKSFLRNECKERPICVTIEPTHYIFTGGEETGYVIGLINYPRFFQDKATINVRALDMARELMEITCQRSCSVVFPDRTEYLQAEGMAPR